MGHADDDAFTADRDSAAMTATTPALGDLIAGAELLVGEPLATKGVLAR
ncbi:hypothetical protein [Nocardia sp. NPDC005366]